jgi:hypothetical protein
MWTATFVTLVVIGFFVGVQEYLERREREEAQKRLELRYFYKLLNKYEEGQYGANSVMSNKEAEIFQRLLNKSAKRVAVYYPGFTAPTLN